MSSFSSCHLHILLCKHFTWSLKLHSFICLVWKTLWTVTHTHNTHTHTHTHTHNTLINYASSVAGGLQSSSTDLSIITASRNSVWIQKHVSTLWLQVAGWRNVDWIRLNKISPHYKRIICEHREDVTALSPFSRDQRVTGADPSYLSGCSVSAAQFLPRGDGIQTSNLPITSRTALPADLQLLWWRGRDTKPWRLFSVGEREETQQTWRRRASLQTRTMFQI